MLMLGRKYITRRAAAEECPGSARAPSARAF
jgi:hypothetical protein